MNCGPAAVAVLTGEKTLHLLPHFAYVRETVGRPKRRGGTHLSEVKAVLERNGYELGEGQPKERRMRLKEWAKTHRSGKWLLMQSHHWFALRDGKQIRWEANRHPRAMLVNWWPVRKVTDPVASQKDMPSQG